MLASLLAAPVFTQATTTRLTAGTATQLVTPNPGKLEHRGKRREPEGRGNSREGQHDVLRGERLDNPGAQLEKHGELAQGKRLNSKLQNDRIFWSLPNFLTVENSSSAPPMTAGQKFNLVARSTYDPVEYPFTAIVASFGQAGNSEPKFGQGFGGYAKRYGTAFADTTIGNFMTGAIFPSLLHQDPRFYQIGTGRLFHRILYAGLQVFVTRSDSGNTQFNFSEILGNGMAAAIANTYHPAPRTLLNSVSIWWTQIGWDAAGYELKEFWPDLKHTLHRQRVAR
jgi:hypothetical protein